MDLTTGLLKSNEAIGSINPVGSYQAGYKNQLEMNKAEMENEKTRYAQDMQYKLQAAISESVNPSTGQPDYIKLRENGAKYGIDAQTMDFARKHLEDNWETYRKVAESKQALKFAAPEGYAELEKSAQTPWPKEQVSKPKQEITQESTLAPAVPTYQTKTITVTGPDGKEVKTNDFGFGATGPTDNTGYKEYAEQLAKETELEQNQYQIANKMDVAGYGDISGVVVGEDGTTTTIYKAPKNKTIEKPEEYFKLHPEQDLETNTKLLLASLGHPPGETEADYQKAYSGAIGDITAPILDKIPPQPIKTGDRKTDLANLNTWREKVAAIKSEAGQAVTKFRDSILDNNFKVAKEFVEAKRNTVVIDGTEYKARDDKAAAIAHALVPTKVEIAEIKGKLSNDITGLKIDLARAARIYAGAMNPGAQVSEGSLMEVAKQVFGTDASWGEMARDLAAAFYSGGIDGAIEFLNGKVTQYDPKKIKERLESVLEGAKKAVDAQLNDTLIGYGSGKQEPPTKYGKDGSEGDNEFTPKTGWFNMPIDTIFKVDPDDENSELGKVLKISPADEFTGISKATKVKLNDGKEYKVIEGDPESEDVELVPWNKEPPAKPTKPKKTGGKKTGGKKVDRSSRGM